MLDVVFRVDDLLSSPAIGNQRSFFGGRVIKAGNVVMFGKKRRIRRLEIVTKEHRSLMLHIRLEHAERLPANGDGANLIVCRKDEFVTENVITR